MKTAYKTRLDHLLLIFTLIIVFGCNNDDDPVGPPTDGDGNEYTIVAIGDQEWLDENLKTTTLNDGTPVPEVTDNVDWIALQTPGLCWYDNDESQHKDVYGALYNWHTIASGKLCPSGWHVPTATEWETLHDFLGNDAANELKESGNAHWLISNQDATNSTGFTALPGGFRVPNVGFLQKGYYGYWWSKTSDPTNTDRVFGREMNAQSKDGSEVVYDPSYGMSVRCIRD